MFYICFGTDNRRQTETLMNIAGGCLCGSVRFQSTAAPLVTRLCWCRVCQTIAAGNATVNVCFPRSAVAIEGGMSDYRSIADSGNVMHRRFCPSCGTHLFSEAESRPHLIFVRAGTLDDPQIAQPAATIWTSQAPSWACIDTRLPHFAEQPPPIS
jgi:hypothetical protein